MRKRARHDPVIPLNAQAEPLPRASTPAPGFKEFLAASLRTTDATAVDQAARDYRGVFGSVHEYLATEIAGHLPPELDWLPWACEPEQLREGYEAQIGRVLWVIGLEGGRVMVFESARGQVGRARRR